MREKDRERQNEKTSEGEVNLPRAPNEFPICPKKPVINVTNDSCCSPPGESVYFHVALNLSLLWEKERSRERKKERKIESKRERK